MPRVDDVILDLSASLPRLGPLRAALAAHDWRAARHLLAEAAPAERTLLTFGTGPADVGDLVGFLGHVLGVDPDDADAAALLAHQHVAAAWRVRTDAPASQVSAEQFRAFDERLRQAEWVLVEAVARRPDDPTLWTVRLTSARGLGLDLSELRRRYDRLAAVDPAHLPGQEQLLQALYPKWGGSWPAAFGFARECVASAPPGSLNPVLVVDAHVEQWLELRQSDPAGATTYLGRDDVRAEVVDAAQRSVWHPSYVPAAGWVRALSTFAFVLGEQGDQQGAADVLGRLGPLASRSPWDLVGDPVAVVRERRARAFGVPR